MNIYVPSKTEIRKLVTNELKKRDKIISKQELRILVEHEVSKIHQDFYKYLDRLRKRIMKIETRLKI